NLMAGMTISDPTTNVPGERPAGTYVGTGKTIGTVTAGATTLTMSPNSTGVVSSTPTFVFSLSFYKWAHTYVNSSTVYVGDKTGQTLANRGISVGMSVIEDDDPNDPTLAISLGPTKTVSSLVGTTGFIPSGSVALNTTAPEANSKPAMTFYSNIATTG